ncbi:hypothetical protein LPB19_06110 [Marinobacter salinisoli]|uniref:DUF3450 domain-containing protein n=1 Tax=Marinobacter salinisoli TaxID=2769486 RepID=A0ABX7N0L8_9GAMM|nr:DUF6776 family protein [Marinobacter salinisoli]QSP95973.1 hypothetical protein LPB19_06110 [Marinobacter salinisoli]
MVDKRKPEKEYVVVRHRPGYRVRRTLILLVFSVSAAAVGYAVGVDQGGAHFSSMAATNEVLEDELDSLEDQYTEARQQVVNLERGRLIDKQALNRARTTIVELETQIASLKSDLTFYQNIMAPSETSKGLQVDSFSLAKDPQPGAYDFKMTLTQVGNNKSYIEGVVAVNVIGLRDEEKEVIALRDLSKDIQDLGVKFRFRYFQDVAGLLVLPENFEPREVQVVARAKGQKSSQAERTFDWDDLTEN